MKDDATLLRGYAHGRSESDFAELVRRHIDFVYGVALRVVNGDAHLAQDATQLVFIDVARKAGRLAGHRTLAGWLFNSTRYAAANLVRTARRRQGREQAAETMSTITSVAGPDWSQLRPLLDDALAQLPASDREVLLLRYLEEHDFPAIGTRLALSEDAARMRVNRALEKLRAILARRGVRSTAAALVAGLTSQATVAAPAGLAATVTGNALAGAGSGIGAFMGLTKLSWGVAGALLLGGLGTAWRQEREREHLQRELTAMPTTLASENANLRRSIDGLAAAARAAEALKISDEEWERLRKEAQSTQVQREDRRADPRGAIPERPVPIAKLATWF